jgi:hypothetical protein
LAKPAIKLDIENAPMLKIRSERRPKVSATFAKNRRNAPELSLLKC